jgi:hypothetical protein
LARIEGLVAHSSSSSVMSSGGSGSEKSASPHSIDYMENTLEAMIQQQGGV